MIFTYDLLKALVAITGAFIFTVLHSSIFLPDFFNVQRHFLSVHLGNIRNIIF